MLLYALVDVGVSYEYEVSQAGFATEEAREASGSAGAVRAAWILSDLGWVRASLGFVALNIAWTTVALVAGRSASRGGSPSAG